MQGFMKFVVRGNMIALAVGVVVGAAFSGVVQAFVASFLTPLVAWASGHAGNFGTAVWHLGSSTISYGVFVNALISFVLTAAVIYFLVVVPVNKIAEELNPHHDLSKAKRACPECMTQIPAMARRCSACASQVEPILDEDANNLIEETPGEIALTGATPSISLKAAE